MYGESHHTALFFHRRGDDVTDRQAQPWYHRATVEEEDENMGEARKRRRAQMDRERCVACGCCEQSCPVGAVKVWRGVWAQVEQARCVGCGRCVQACPASVITLQEAEA